MRVLRQRGGKNGISYQKKMTLQKQKTPCYFPRAIASPPFLSSLPHYVRLLWLQRHWRMTNKRSHHVITMSSPRIAYKGEGGREARAMPAVTVPLLTPPPSASTSFFSLF